MQICLRQRIFAIAGVNAYYGLHRNVQSYLLKWTYVRSNRTDGGGCVQLITRTLILQLETCLFSYLLLC